jgi:hypothetical protein
VAQIRVGDQLIPSYEAGGLDKASAKRKADAFATLVDKTIRAAGYPEKADPARIDNPMVVAVLAVFLLLVAVVYGSIAAVLVEMFPTRIRYTAMSLPYHIGNGWFGGFLPTTAFALVAATGNIYAGLWYLIALPQYRSSWRCCSCAKRRTPRFKLDTTLETSICQLTKSIPHPHFSMRTPSGASRKPLRVRTARSRAPTIILPRCCSLNWRAKTISSVAST